MTDPQRLWLDKLQSQLQERRRDHLWRELRPIDSAGGPTLRIGADVFIQFCSNNYLGLADDPEVIDAARAAAAQFGAGSGASRLVTGSLAIHHELEAALAQFKHAEAALVFPTGFMANLAVLTTFAGESDLIVSDKLNHASLLDGAKFSAAAHRTFSHKNYSRAAELLSRDTQAQTRFLVTDTVFSMDGDTADLPAACSAAEENNALIIIDEAHATGVLGPTGAGLAEAQNVSSRIAVSIGTLSKALGSLGGFVTGPRTVIDALINLARPFIFTTALAPANAAAALAACRIIQRDPHRRAHVLALAQRVKKELIQMGYNCGESSTPIIPVILGRPEHALAAADFLHAKKILAPAIRPPAVSPNSARLRLSIMATHTDAHIDQLLQAMRSFRTHL